MVSDRGRRVDPAGWFYHASDDASATSLAQLLDVHRKLVGRDAVLLLEVPPDRRGLFADADVEALSVFGKAMRSYYDVSLSLPARFNVIDMRKDIESGQQVESFAVDALIDGSWTEVARVWRE